MCMHEEDKEEFYLELTTEEMKYIEKSIAELTDKLEKEYVGMRGLIEQIINEFSNRQRDLIKSHVTNMVKEMGKKKINKKIQRMEESIGKLPTIGDIKAVVEKEVNKRLDKLDSERDKFEQDKAKYENTFNQLLITKLQEKENELNAVHAHEIDGLKAELKEEKDKTSEKDKMINQLNKELQSYERKLTDEEEDRKNVKEQLNDWKELASHYEPILEALKNCPTFSGLINERSFEKVSDLIKAIGESIDFAKAVHDCAKEEKKNQSEPEPMTDAEKQVYRAINDCYKYIWSEIKFDIFVLPDRKSIDEEFYKISFNKDEVVNMQNPKDKSCKFTQQVYVPMLIARNNNVYATAQVKAGNN